MEVKLITRDTDYAVRALVFMLNNKGRIVSVSELVEKLGIPKPFLRKTLQKLSKCGILNNYKGKGGGFELAVSPKRVSLLKLVEVFQGPINFSECLFKRKPCPNVKKCFLRKRLKKIEKLVVKELRKIKLDSLFNKNFEKMLVDWE
jgi:Rrf2 family protein